MEKRKVNLGLKRANEFSLDERRLIIEEWLQSGKTKREIWQKYTGEPLEKGRMVRWMRELGLDIPKKWSTISTPNSDSMAKTKKDSSLEVIQMQAKIKELEKALINSELRATAYETMIEIAEKELKISIRKKSNTKQSLR
jgi:hypothetical protein